MNCIGFTNGFFFIFSLWSNHEIDNLSVEEMHAHVMLRDL